MLSKIKLFRIALIEKDLTQEKLAEQLGITSAYLSMIVNGKRRSVSVQHEISSILDLGEDFWEEAA